MRGSTKFVRGSPTLTTFFFIVVVLFFSLMRAGRTIITLLAGHHLNGVSLAGR